MFWHFPHQLTRRRSNLPLVSCLRLHPQRNPRTVPLTPHLTFVSHIFFNPNVRSHLTTLTNYTLGHTGLGRFHTRYYLALNLAPLLRFLLHHQVL